MKDFKYSNAILTASDIEPRGNAWPRQVQTIIQIKKEGECQRAIRRGRERDKERDKEEGERQGGIQKTQCHHESGVVWCGVVWCGVVWCCRIHVRLVTHILRAGNILVRLG